MVSSNYPTEPQPTVTVDTQASNGGEQMPMQPAGETKPADETKEDVTTNEPKPGYPAVALSTAIASLTTYGYIIGTTVLSFGLEKGINKIAMPVVQKPRAFKVMQTSERLIDKATATADALNRKVGDPMGLASAVVIPAVHKLERKASGLADRGVERALKKPIVRTSYSWAKGLFEETNGMIFEYDDKVLSVASPEKTSFSLSRPAAQPPVPSTATPVVAIKV